MSERTRRGSRRTLPVLARLRGVPLPSAPPSSLPRHDSRRCSEPGRGRAAAECARRHKAKLERWNSRRTSARPGNPLAARPHGAGGANTASLSSFPLPPPGGQPSAARGCCGVRAAQAPQSVLGELRRKNARALGGAEVIKGKEPAAGGSGRFSCCGHCCLGFGPPEGCSLEGRRCRPQ